MTKLTHEQKRELALNLVGTVAVEVPMDADEEQELYDSFIETLDDMFGYREL